MDAPSFSTNEKRLVAIFLIILFAQNPPWPIWEYQSTLVALSVIFGVLITTKNGLYYFRGGYMAFFSIVSGLLYFFLAHGLVGSFRLSSLVFVLTLFLIFRSETRTGALAFNFISYVFAGMLCVSLVFWGLWQLGLPLPSSSMNYGTWKGDEGALQLDNFYFFISEGQTLISRFYGVFDEPGVVGTLAALILCGLRFDFGLKRSWILLMAGIFAWSLAFFILSTIGFFLFKKDGKSKLVLPTILILVCVVAAILVSNILPTYDSASMLLLYRILNFSEYGISSRTGELLNNFFFEYVGSLRVLFGEGTAFFQQHPELLSGQGANIYIIEYGLFGMVFLLMAYISVINSSINTRFQGYLLLVVFLLSFLQRPHLMTPWQIVLFWSILCAWAEASTGQDPLLKKD